jgi:hypothetical protein
MKNKTAIVITLGKNHIHYCKALIASIDYFNPNTPIIILKDGDFNTDFFEKRINVTVVDSKEINKIHQLDLYVLLNKLNILFLPQLGYDFDCFIHLDADSVLTNKIDFDSFTADQDFYILQGNEIDRNDPSRVKIMSQYAFNPIDFPEYNFDLNHLFFFSASHIGINKRIIPRLIGLLEVHRFELNKEFLNDKRIKFNDQGFLNLIVNYLSYNGEIKVKLNDCGIYGKQNEVDFPNLTLENVLKKADTGVMFIHYTGSSRKVKMISHNFGMILDFFLRLYYDNLSQYYFNESIRIIKFHFNWFWRRFIGKIRYYKKKLRS